MKKLTVALCLFVAGCQTEQVTAACQSAEEIVVGVQRELGILPVEAKLVATAAGVAAKVCSSTQYAAEREKVKAWLLTRMRR